ncbi:hypothetical protein [Saccharibacillus sacchari]|uniref:hypothetical protein n=1 Tax=Saccharibacillus sacchari TaxID=456493 RepID=UPI0004B9664C|nr:hypothetical protein [Saccharibacillus sacchari]
MAVKENLPIAMQELLRQLVVNGDIRMAGIVLYAYCRRKYQANDETAARWMVAYFRREFPHEMERHASKLSVF